MERDAEVEAKAVTVTVGTGDVVEVAAKAEGIRENPECASGEVGVLRRNWM